MNWNDVSDIKLPVSKKKWEKIKHRFPINSTMIVWVVNGKNKNQALFDKEDQTWHTGYDVLSKNLKKVTHWKNVNYIYDPENHHLYGK